MDKLEYADIYRFLVSLGVILIALGLLVPWLFLRESFDLGMTRAEIAQLTPAAQTVIAYRQSMILWIITHLYLLFLVPAVPGLALVIRGLQLWSAKKQIIEDQGGELRNVKTRLEIEKIRRELEPLTETQRYEKGVAKELMEPEQKQDVLEYFRVESLFLDKLKECFPPDSLLLQQRVQQVSLDAVIVFREETLPDVIVDIRTAATEMSDSVLEAMFIHFSQEVTLYKKAIGRPAIVIPVFILSDAGKEAVFTEHSGRVLEKQEGQGALIRPYYIREAELNRMECKDLVREIQGRAGATR